MASIITSTYQKTGAVFATAQDAFNDKNSLFPQELTDSINAANSNMLALGVLTQPNYPTWDPDTCILGVVKHVSSAEAYYENRTFDGTACVEYASQAGWTFIDDVVTPA